MTVNIQTRLVAEEGNSGAGDLLSAEEEFSLAEWSRRQAQESGVPEYVEDAAVIANAAKLVATLSAED